MWRNVLSLLGSQAPPWETARVLQKVSDGTTQGDAQSPWQLCLSSFHCIARHTLDFRRPHLNTGFVQARVTQGPLV